MRASVGFGVVKVEGVLEVLEMLEVPKVQEVLKVPEVRCQEFFITLRTPSTPQHPSTSST
jgi:hypothetical protein